MENEIIIVKQLPIIEEQLKGIKVKFQEEVNNALSLECNEDSYKIVKGVRADLTKIFNSLEEKRKATKKQILKPYEDFEKVYKECVNDVYMPAKTQLDKKIFDVEAGLKAQKEQEVRKYFYEYLKSKDIDFITFEDAKINITLNASKKSLKEHATAFIDKVSDDLKMIDTQENKSEILVEYKKNLNVSQAILTVSERHKAIEEERKRLEEFEKAEELKKVAEEQIEEVIESEPEETSAPSVMEIPEEEQEDITEPTEEQVYQMTFTVVGTLEKLKKLKNYLKEEGLINE